MYEISVFARRRTLNVMLTLNNFFLSNNPSINNNFQCNVRQPNELSQFSFTNVDEYDVSRSLMKIKSNAIGEDGIPIRFIKLILHYILSPLTHIINHCFTTSRFPNLWKIATVIPVAKVPSASTMKDYRPISILPSFSKVCESLIAEQINEFISANNLLSPYQSGFRAGHSCESAMIKVLDDIRVPFDEGKITLLCLLDFSKAFDSVNHNILVTKLKSYFGFSSSSASLIANYLDARMQRVKVNNLCSDYKCITTGVPQGSILGPLLFSLFINDIFTVCKDFSMHAYADDVQLYSSNRIGLVDDLCYRLNEDLTAIAKWATDNNLCLNSKKSYILPISKMNLDHQSIPYIYLNDNKLQLVDKVKNLGFYVNTKLSCTDHVNQVIKKVYYTLRCLRLSAEFTPVETKKRLVKLLIMPIITYSVLVYSKLDSHSSHKLFVAFNNVTRYVFALRRFSHVSDVSKAILGCSITSYLDARNCIFLHKLIYSKTPPYLYNKLRFSVSNRSLNLILPKFNYLQSQRLFFINAIRLWNLLPNNIKNINRTSSFKHSILLHFSDQ